MRGGIYGRGGGRVYEQTLASFDTRYSYFLKIFFCGIIFLLLFYSLNKTETFFK